jgi:hypothetical protein
VIWIIIERQVNAEYGAAIVKRLVQDILVYLSEISGFSRHNVFFMRKFYLLYRKDAKVQPQVAEIG